MVSVYYKIKFLQCFKKLSRPRRSAAEQNPDQAGAHVNFAMTVARNSVDAVEWCEWHAVVAQDAQSA